MYGTQELTIFIPSWGRAMHGTQEVNTLRCCLTLFRPARPDQSYLAVVTTGLRWNGGRYAALPGPLGQHVVVWCIRTLIVAQSSTRLSLTHATAHCAPHTYQPDPAPNKKNCTPKLKFPQTPQIHRPLVRLRWLGRGCNGT